MRDRGPYDAWILDLDGVLWTGVDAIEGSAEAVGRLQAAGLVTLFVTNNSFTSISDLEAKLARFGVGAESMVVSSAAAAASLVGVGARAFVLGGPGIVEALEARDVQMVDEAQAERERVDAVVVGLDWHLTYDRLSAAVLAIANGATFVATNGDPSYPNERGLLPGGGAIVQAVRTATGVEPEVAGKPHSPQARIALAKIRSMLGDIAEPRCIMVGDRPDTDGLFAQELDADFGLVLSGVTGASDLPTEPPAVLVADRLSDLVDQVLGRQSK